MQSVLLMHSKSTFFCIAWPANQIEHHGDFSNCVLIGLQPRGVYLLNRIAKLLQEEYHIQQLQQGKLDITFFRDDFRRSDKPHAA